MKKIYLILLVTIVFVLISGIFFYFVILHNYNSIHNNNCVGEGKNFFFEGVPYKYLENQKRVQGECCDGLVKIDEYKDGQLVAIDALTNEGVSEYTVSAFCTKCGDKICKSPEDKYNCEEDCLS